MGTEKKQGTEINSSQSSGERSTSTQPAWDIMRSALGIMLCPNIGSNPAALALRIAVKPRNAARY
jgi:hypothetical protein